MSDLLHSTEQGKLQQRLEDLKLKVRVNFYQDATRDTVLPVSERQTLQSVFDDISDLNKSVAQAKDVVSAKLLVSMSQEIYAIIAKYIAKRIGEMEAREPDEDTPSDLAILQNMQTEVKQRVDALVAAAVVDDTAIPEETMDYESRPQTITYAGSDEEGNGNVDSDAVPDFIEAGELELGMEYKPAAQSQDGISPLTVDQVLDDVRRGERGPLLPEEVIQVHEAKAPEGFVFSIVTEASRVREYLGKPDFTYDDAYNADGRVSSSLIAVYRSTQNI